MARSIFALLFAAGASALAPTQRVCARRQALAQAGAAVAAAVAAPAFADDAPPAPEAPVEIVFPTARA